MKEVVDSAEGNTKAVFGGFIETGYRPGGEGASLVLREKKSPLADAEMFF
jgi:hypothetical protein